MATVFLDVSTYTALQYGGSQASSGLRASISLSVPNALVNLLFYADDVAIAANFVTTLTSGMKSYTVNYPYYQYSGVIDLLRNEKPIKFLFNDAILVSYITAADEPVGEEE